MSEEELLKSLQRKSTQAFERTLLVLSEVHAAREKCPDDFEGLPDVDNSVKGRMSAKHTAQILTEATARWFLEGNGTWSFMAMDALAQICVPQSDAERRQRLVRLTALQVAWIEAIDRRAVKPTNGVVQPPPP